MAVSRENDNSRTLRENIVTFFYCDIEGICETYLNSNQTIELF